MIEKIYEGNKWNILDRHFHFYIALIIKLEELAFLRIMLREVSGTSAVYLGRLAGNTEVFDQILAFLQFLFFKTENSTGSCKGEGKTEDLYKEYRFYRIPAKPVSWGEDEQQNGRWGYLKNKNKKSVDKF